VKAFTRRAPHTTAIWVRRFFPMRVAPRVRSRGASPRAPWR
jgi:hypothetical protein